MIALFQFKDIIPIFDMIFEDAKEIIFYPVSLFRCDRNNDCTDISDEKGCKIVVIDANNYIPENPPKNAKVKVQVKLLKILEIGEVEMKFRTQYTLYQEWLDPRIIFNNLHGDHYLNSLVQDEKQKIWTPTLILDNTDKKIRTTTDDESVIFVKREGNYTLNTMVSIDNTYLFKGEDNPLDMNRVYETEWICDYQMNWFPFDTQQCQMVFSVPKDMNNFVKIVTNGHSYLGPVELTQYFVRDTKMFSELLSEEAQQAIVYEVTLGRRLLGTILTIFVPTVLLNIIGRVFNINLFKFIDQSIRKQFYLRDSNSRTCYKLLQTVFL